MVDSESLVLFFLASLLLALAPGPDNIFVLAQSAQKGKSAGLVVTLGLCTGLIVHTTAVAFGVAAIFQTSTIAFNVLKYTGAAYLLYLAWQAFHTQGEQFTMPESDPAEKWKLYRRGIIMNVTNPKVSIFFLAFLPQFVDPARGSIILQMYTLGFVFIVATILVFGAISLAAGTIGEKLRKSQRAQLVLDRMAGTIFAALAIKLAITERL